KIKIPGNPFPDKISAGSEPVRIKENEDQSKKIESLPADDWKMGFQSRKLDEDESKQQSEIFELGSSSSKILDFYF
ncbi:MAG: hypothetical protein JW774_06935, partial [Candidatus Aureabacteria bacterium]|nr:hypothetical protein [Candidatus Auribacterota bacterium]